MISPKAGNFWPLNLQPEYPPGRTRPTPPGHRKEFPMKSKYETVIFDLDGTILDSAPGIYAGLKYALDKMGQPFPADLDLRRCLGPPLTWTFTDLLMVPENQAAEAVDIYRDYYGAKGIYQAEPYPGIMDLLRDLELAGAAICLATTKSQVMALKMLDYFGLTPLIKEAAMSSGRDKKSHKQEMIADVLARAGGRPASAVMIGDTFYDAEGAVGAGVDFIGVLYGYGTREDMAARGGKKFVSDVGSLRALLL